ncbi:lysylphosphatidylglycerol synthetase-like protein (DUF2156 family) [Frigoribacterium sp. PhB24]|nr:lysylphosphatidylglycerol synthetase-like protein (DUF2156 family) [Frigoribacterium sp. PhB24]
MAGLATRIVTFVSARPVSLTVALSLIVLAFASGSVTHAPSERLRDLVGAGLDPFEDRRSWLLVFGSVFVAGGPTQLVLAVIGVLVLVGAAERRMGWVRTVVAYLVTAVVATGVGVTVQALGQAVGETWALEVAAESTLHPFTPALGTIMAASAFFGPLWRRRIRLVGFSVVLAFVLYDGHPSGLYALLGALVGLALGVVLADRRAERGWLRSSHHEVRRLASTIVAVTAVGPVLTLLARSPIGALSPLGMLFRDVLPGRSLSAACAAAGRGAPDRHVPPVGACARAAALAGIDTLPTVLLSLLPLVVLLVSAWYLRRGRRLALDVAVAVNGLLAVFAGLYYVVLPVTTDPVVDRPRHVVERVVLAALAVAVPAAVAVGLFLLRRHFGIGAEGARRPRYAFVVVVSGLVLAATFAAAGWAGRASFVPAIGPRTLLLDVPERFVPVGFVGLTRIGPVPDGGVVRAAFEWVGPLWWLVVLVGLVVAAARPGDVRPDAARAQVREIVHRGTPGTLSHMALWEGNQYWFSADGRAVVAHRVVAGIAITTGEPLCPADRIPEVTREFARWCDDQGLTPVFYSVRGELTPLYDEMGWATLPVGEETVLHPATFAMTGKKWQDVRSSINRATKNGIRAEWTRYADLRPAVARQIGEISEQWVAEKNLPEMGFTLGGVDELKDPDVALVLALDEDDSVQAVTSWLPSWSDGEVVGWTLDFMRRRPDSMNGVMEFVIASSALAMKEQGVEFLSLSAAPLATSGSPEGPATQTERVLTFLGRVLEPAYGFQTLLTFKKKFQPEFVPLVMAFPDPVQLPAIGTALGRAYLPDLSVGAVVRLVRTVV